ncbi:hypothetical protein DPMN_088421 [Dreissena polymorpha]|uniref:BTB domain-containing protein n=2 Tax=Dreissena polymorpha TaxID=45954 RepID=A0A9D4KUI1_DREPO|nr:hypothetical protein DPMN_088421 [Dreissena polymorpha]
MNAAKKVKCVHAGANQAEAVIDVTKFGGESGLADVILVVEDVRIPVIKIVLSLVSPVFRAMFESEFKEKNLKEISLPGKKLGPFLHFLNWIYPDIRATVTAQNAFPNARLASEYQVKQLTEECDECLWRYANACIFSETKQPDRRGLYSETKSFDALHYLHLAEQFGLKKLANICVQLASERNLQKRKDGFQSWKISLESQRKITNLAVERLDQFESDTRSLIDVLDQEEIRDRITDEFNTCLTPSAQLRALRLAYVYCGHSSDVYERSFMEIQKELKEKKMYLSDKSFLLLPELVKADINRMFSLNNDFF